MHQSASATSRWVAVSQILTPSELAVRIFDPIAKRDYLRPVQSEYRVDDRPAAVALFEEKISQPSSRAHIPDLRPTLTCGDHLRSIYGQAGVVQLILSPSHTGVCSSSAWLLAPKKRGCAGDAAKSGSAAKRVRVTCANSLWNFCEWLA